MNVRTQVFKPIGQPQHNQAWRAKRTSQQASNRLLRLNAWLPPYDDTPAVAGVALTEKARLATFTESNL